jgi:carbon starvation protein CstA
MISFIAGIAVLLAGYILYGRLAEKVFAVDPHRLTPAVRINDGVDFVEMDWKRALLIQLLNIAGTGPIFGAITGAYFGPAAYVWIVLGCIFAGAVHDFMCGMISVRNGGASVSEIVGKYLGKIPLYIMRIFSVLLLLLVGVVFIYTPARVLELLIRPGSRTVYAVCLALIISYYVLAAILPIDKFIGRIYPIFGAALIIMGFSLIFALFITGEIRNVPELTFENLNPGVFQGGKFTRTLMTTHVFPFVLVTIACGAISGFHATQSPMIARCLKNETEGRKVFYGAMILEGIIAMIWATVAMAHFHPEIPVNPADMRGLVQAGSPAAVVTKSSGDLLGIVGGILTVLGVLACPLSSGDTAFRSARLILADSLRFDQRPLKNRLVIVVPLFMAGTGLVIFAALDTANFNIIWRYFAWSNQTLATIVLWAECAYLAKAGRPCWITLIPAAFMTVVTSSYFMSANECLGPVITRISGSIETAYAVSIFLGLALALMLTMFFMVYIGIGQKGALRDEG